MNIVVIGGGFAGVNFARALANKKKFQVTLVDKNNYNFFPPLIYQVATAFLEPSSISYPFRKLFVGKENLHFRLGEVKKIIPSENKIIVNKINKRWISQTQVCLLRKVCIIQNLILSKN